MKSIDQSLRKHITLILLIKVVVIIGIRMAFFPSLKQQHPPSEIYFQPTPESHSLRSPHD